ncbi:MAG: hypothetical protein Q9160_008469 [Pyrenula sp. 1 TL-2023]
MGSVFAMKHFRTRLKIVHLVAGNGGQKRFQSSSDVYNLADGSRKTRIPKHDSVELIAPSSTPLARLPTSSLLRSLFLSSFFSSPFLFRPGLALFQKVANSSSSWLNPDGNPVLRGIIAPLIYKQFCAGRNKAEIQRTASDNRRLGFSGIVLCYGKEVQVRADNKILGHNQEKVIVMDTEIKQWRDGNIQTLGMIGEGDWLGIKYSGAGVHITNALIKGSTPPSKFVEAMQTICETAAARGCRIWIDAEQQVLQSAIDEWTFGFMRRYNKIGRRALLYSTVQAYLKSSREKVQHQLALSQREGWRLGIKLVRGAYISNDQRDRIHDTKADTDNSYNGIVRDLLHGKFSALLGDNSPQFDLLLAGHNSESIRGAVRLASDLASESRLRIYPEFAQLQGMADEIGCEILQHAENVNTDKALPLDKIYTPKVYKCLTWGSLQDCMQYLTRRLVENRGAADRMREGSAAFRKELKRRILRRLAKA